MTPPPSHPMNLVRQRRRDETWPALLLALAPPGVSRGWAGLWRVCGFPVNSSIESMTMAGAERREFAWGRGRPAAAYGLHGAAERCAGVGVLEAPGGGGHGWGADGLPLGILGARSRPPRRNSWGGEGGVKSKLIYEGLY